MEDGRFVEQGHHSELMALEGQYHELARSQSAKEPSQ